MDQHDGGVHWLFSLMVQVSVVTSWAVAGTSMNSPGSDPVGWRSELGRYIVMGGVPSSSAESG
jgi:hypothetical protein